MKKKMQENGNTNRIIPRDEVLEANRALWMEKRGQSAIFARVLVWNQRGNVVLQSHKGNGEFLYWAMKMNEYGKTWRCWANEPTQEEAADMPWA
jgi:hypothetical protein